MASRAASVTGGCVSSIEVQTCSSAGRCARGKAWSSVRGTRRCTRTRGKTCRRVRFTFLVLLLLRSPASPKTAQRFATDRLAPAPPGCPRRLDARSILVSHLHRDPLSEPLPRYTGGSSRAIRESHWRYRTHTRLRLLLDGRDGRRPGTSRSFAEIKALDRTHHRPSRRSRAFAERGRRPPC